MRRGGRERPGPQQGEDQEKRAEDLAGSGAEEVAPFSLSFLVASQVQSSYLALAMGVATKKWCHPTD